jgi:hypothetical protein
MKIRYDERGRRDARKDSRRFRLIELSLGSLEAEVSTKGWRNQLERLIVVVDAQSPDYVQNPDVGIPMRDFMRVCHKEKGLRVAMECHGS